MLNITGYWKGEELINEYERVTTILHIPLYRVSTLLLQRIAMLLMNVYSSRNLGADYMEKFQPGLKFRPADRIEKNPDCMKLFSLETDRK